MALDIEYSTGQFIYEHGRDSMARAFHLAARSLESQDYVGYDFYFGIYVCLARRSGLARQLAVHHADIAVVDRTALGGKDLVLR